ncbi:MAG: hypothetical protein ACR2IH_05230 [Pyrinomonadaceae bacterium]
MRSRLSGSDEWVEFEARHEMNKILEGVGNTETITAMVDGRPFEGRALRLFESSTRLWRIYWVDNDSSEMGDAVVGSFENGVGTFFGEEIFDGREVAVQFKWDATDPEKPVWSQAFSPDGGKSWEWNWYMYFTRRKSGGIANEDLNADKNIKVIELRNYLIKPGRRDEFIDLFEENFTRSQNILGGYTLGQYRVKGADDNFFWIRGFADMPARNKFLNDFYFGSPSWKLHKAAANSMLLNNDNVHLLKPLFLSLRADENAGMVFNSDWFGRRKGITVVDFYTSNTKLEKIIEFVRNKYVALFSKAKAANASFWVSETTPNDFPGLPVFQDKNLLVQMTFYKNELEYQAETKSEDSKMNDELSSEMHDLVTLKNTLILYPTARSFSSGTKPNSRTD